MAAGAEAEPMAGMVLMATLAAMVTQSNGYRVVRQADMTLSVEKAKELYDEHSNTQFFDDLVSFMTRCGLAIHTRCVSHSLGILLYLLSACRT
jgi:hypothetical protein